MKSNRYVIYHLHTDPKFITLENAFDINIFDNRFIFIDTHKLAHEYTFPYNDIQIFERTSGSLDEIVKLVNNADLLIIYGLEMNKAYICNKVNKKVPIIWRFFGSELYDQMYHDMHSKYTLDVLDNKHIDIRHRLSKLFSNIFLYGFNYKRLIPNTYFRADAIACLYYEEYLFLSKRFHLPTFLQIPYEENNESIPYLKKEGIIIIGNSRNKSNNHIDILKIIMPYENYDYILPFNYGEISSYSKAVTLQTEHHSNFTVVRNFLPLEEYIQMFKSSAAFVFNAYRQMAMGNIFIALRNNVKIYLNKKNSAYDWFISNGFYVSTIDRLENDLKTGKIYQTENEYYRNIHALQKLTVKYNNRDFVDKIIQIISKQQ